MRKNDCKSLSLPASSSTSSACSSTSKDSAALVFTPEEKVWNKLFANSEQAEQIEKITRGQTVRFCRMI